MGKPRRVTLLDVAEHAGVSKSTVSLVLQNDARVKSETRERVEQAIAALNYVYNRKAAALRSQRSDLVGIIINDLALSYPALVAHGLEKSMFEQGFTPMLASCSDDVGRLQRIVRTYQEYNVGGFILCPAPDTDSNWLEGVRRAGYPVVCMMREVPFSKAPVVVANNQTGTEMATQHLLSLGHKRIGFLGGHSHTSDFHQRLNGYLNSMRSAGVSVPENWICPIPQARDAGQQAISQLLARDRQISAVLCFSDVVAYGVYRYCQSHNMQVGKDLAVVGFDDNLDSRLTWPPLTSVRVDAEKIGSRAWSLMAKQLRGEDLSDAREVVEVSLMVRASCGANGSAPM